MRGTSALIAASIATVSAITGAYLWGTQALGALPALGRHTPIAVGQQSLGSPGPQAVAQPAPPPVPAPPPPLLHPAAVKLSDPGFTSWALLNRGTGQIVGSPNLAATNVTASMIKGWLASDFLRRSAEKRQQPSNATLSRLTFMIRDSDNEAASFFSNLDGGAASITRLVRMCGLTDSRPNIDWANVLMSARDAARMGACIGDGRAAGTKWTSWVLNEMRNVRGAGRFGIITALPAQAAQVTAIKNGWIVRSDGRWHVNCMAVGTDWTLAVMTVYPASLGLDHGAGVCRSITQQLMA